MPGPVIRTIRCKDAAAFFRHLSPEHDPWRQTGGQSCWIFRGQSNDFPLVPSAMRPGVFPAYGIGVAGTHSDPINLDEQLTLEDKAFVRFTSTCMDLDLSLPEDGQMVRGGLTKIITPRHEKELKQGIDFPHPLLRSLYALAQHHGIPTRLLDWSRSPWVAAYFACYKMAAEHVAQSQGKPSKYDPNADMVVWALREHIVFSDAVRAEKELGVGIVDVTAPYNSNPNLRAQRGLFTLIRNIRPPAPTDFRHRPLQDVVRQIAKAVYNARGNKIFDNGPLMIRFRLRQTEARRVLRMLYDYGISYGSLHPGYDGAVKTISERQYWAEQLTTGSNRTLPRRPRR